MLLILHLLLDTLKDTDGSRVIINASGSTQSSLDDFGSRYEVVSEAVIEATLELEEVLDGLEEGEGISEWTMGVALSKAVDTADDDGISDGETIARDCASVVDGAVSCVVGNGKPSSIIACSLRKRLRDDCPR